MTPIDSTLITDRLEAGTLIRDDWGDGYERACLLAAIAPEVARAEDAAACPAEFMPSWMAKLTVWIDDNGSDATWSDRIRRYAAVAARWHVLTPEHWVLVDQEIRARIVEEAIRHTTVDDKGTKEACEAVVKALLYGTDADLDAAKSAVYRVAEAEGASCVDFPDYKVCKVTLSAAEGDATIDDMAAICRSAAWSAQADAADDAGIDAAIKAVAHAEDRICDVIFSALEAACSAVEEESRHA